MKYMLIIYGNEELWNSVEPAEQQRLFAAFDEFNKAHYATGELLGAYGMADPAASKLVRLRDGQPAVTDGPYLETKEHLASWYLIDVDSEQRALEIAARSCKRRFPRCGGFLIWMGHDSFPCTANTSILDFHGDPKPAATAIGAIFRGDD